MCLCIWVGFFCGWVLVVVVVLGRFFCGVVCFLEECIYEVTVDLRS